MDYSISKHIDGFFKKGNIFDTLAIDEDMNLTIHLELMHMAKKFQDANERLLRTIAVSNDPKIIDQILDDSLKNNEMFKDLIMEGILRNEHTSFDTLVKIAKEMVNSKDNLNATYIRICKRLLVHRNTTKDIIMIIADCPCHEILKSIVDCDKTPDDVLLTLVFHKDKEISKEALDELRKRRSSDPKI